MVKMDEQYLAERLLDKDSVIPYEEAVDFAKVLEHTEDDVRYFKGVLWNRCERGTRDDLIRRYGWNRQTIKEYSQYAREVEYGTLGYNAWRFLFSYKGISKEDRLDYISFAVKNNA